MKPATAKSAKKIQALLGRDYKVLEFDASTRTAADAAAAIGCEVAQIAKALIFAASASRRPVLVMTSGSVRADEAKVTELLGETIERASADFVREKTGFAIGGVPPVGHREAAVVFIDESLMAFETLWAAAGTPNSVFELSPEQLRELTGGRVANVATDG